MTTLTRVSRAVESYTIDDLVNALQPWANSLVNARKNSRFYIDDTFFMTVGPADATANGTTSETLANIRAERIRAIFPKSTPDNPRRTGVPGNAQ